jgi:hypothetical protein
LANQVGMKLSPFSRGVAVGTLNLVNLLKLARVADAHPSTVLRLAGKSDEADLIEAVYGSATETLTASERELLTAWRKLAPSSRDLVRELVQHLTHKGRGDSTQALALKKRGRST